MISNKSCNTPGTVAQVNEYFLGFLNYISNDAYQEFPANKKQRVVDETFNLW